MLYSRKSGCASEKTMWLQRFIPILVTELQVAQVSGEPVRCVQQRAYDVHFETMSTFGRVHIEYRYPQKHFLVALSLRRRGDRIRSMLRRFAIPTAILMLLKVGGVPEGALQALAACVVDWIEQEGA